MTCSRPGCIVSHGVRAHHAGCPEYLGLPEHAPTDLCPEWPNELTEGPCILDHEHPEPDHVNLNGYTWVSP